MQSSQECRSGSGTALSPSGPEGRGVRGPAPPRSQMRVAGPRRAPRPSLRRFSAEFSPARSSAGPGWFHGSRHYHPGTPGAGLAQQVSRPPQKEKTAASWRNMIHLSAAISVPARNKRLKKLIGGSVARESTARRRKALEKKKNRSGESYWASSVRRTSPHLAPTIV